LQRLLKHPHMKWALVILLFAASSAVAQTATPAPRSFFNRMMHPFGPPKTKTPKYQDPRLRGLVLEVQVPTEPVRLSEVRQLRVHVALTNLSPNPVALDFPTSQRIDIQLLNPAGEVLTRWSENRAFTEEIGNVLINPREQIVYNETIATRELQPGRVYSVEVFFPKYPELRTRQKFMTAP
jgi:intracellular proteinase inhibitor BsuPI